MTHATDPAAAYCGVCETIFVFTDRDLFDHEVFCPSCASRTERADRGIDLAALAAARPQAAVYGTRTRA